MNINQVVWDLYTLEYGSPSPPICIKKKMKFFSVHTEQLNDCIIHFSYFMRFYVHQVLKIFLFVLYLSTPFNIIAMYVVVSFIVVVFLKRIFWRIGYFWIECFYHCNGVLKHFRLKQRKLHFMEHNLDQNETY